MPRRRQGERLRLAGLDTVHRSLELLKVLAEFPEGATVRQLVDAVGFNRTTVLRILVTFQDHGFVAWEADTGRYRLGTGVLELAARFLAHHDLGRLARPYLEEIRDLTGETASLYVRDGDHRICLYRVESLQPVRIAVAVGQRLPLHLGAAGKVLLASLPDERVAALLERAGVPEAVRRRLWDERPEIRRSGVARSFGERQPDIASLAVAVRRVAGDVVGAVAVSGPRSRWTEERMNHWLPVVRQVVERLSRHVP